MKKKLVSIIVPVYNVEKYLDRCVKSLINQTYKNLEIILVDDGSTDSSGILCNGWKRRDSRIKVIHQKNKGLPGARNSGIDISKGKYIVFIDSDDYVSEDMVETHKNIIEKNNADLSVCSFYYDYSGNLVQADTSNELNIMDKEKFLDNMIYGYYKAYAWNKMYIRDIIGDLRYDEKQRYFEDLYFTVMYSLKCKKICYTSKPLCYYYQNDNSIVHTADSNKLMYQVKAIDRIINIIKENNVSKVYYGYENQNITIAMNLKYILKKEDKFGNREKIKFIDDIIKKYKKDKCFVKANGLTKIKLLMCLYCNNFYQYAKRKIGGKL